MGHDSIEFNSPTVPEFCVKNGSFELLEMYLTPLKKFVIPYTCIYLHRDKAFQMSLLYKQKHMTEFLLRYHLDNNHKSHEERRHHLGEWCQLAVIYNELEKLLKFIQLFYQRQDVTAVIDLYKALKRNT